MPAAYNELCPYCEASINIHHDDDFEEDALYEYQCPKCEKYFTYSMSISVDFALSKADCLNGGNHVLSVYSYKYMKNMVESPYYRIECLRCGEVRNYFPIK